MGKKAQRRKREKDSAKTAMERGTEAQPAAPRGRRWILVAAALVPLFVYLPTLSHGFLFDDFVLFQKSPSLSDLGSIPRGFLTDVGGLRKGDGAVISSYYRPVFLALSTLYYQAVGGEPGSWHFAAVLLAALIGALACGFFLRLGFSPPVALLASLVFSLHPSHVSSIAWASGLQELCAAAFVFCTLLAVLAARREDRGSLRLALVALFYGLALLSKEVAVGLLPFVAFWALHEAKSDRQASRRLWRATAVLGGMTAVYLMVRVAVLGGLAVPSYGAPSLGASLPAVPVALFTYLRLLAWPVGFAIFRPERPIYGPLDTPVLLSVAALAMLAGLAYWAIRKKREIALPAAWLVASLLPVLNLWALHPQWMVTDRYLFLPSLALPWGLACLRPRNVQLAALAVLTAAFALLTVRYSAIFRDERTFIAAMEKAEPTSPLVFGEKGRLLLQDGKVDAARAALVRALELDPVAPGVLETLGDLAIDRGDLDAAEGYYRRALVVRPNASRGFKLVALARSRAGQRDHATSLIEESVRRWPEDFEVQLLQGLFLGAAGDREKAQAAFEAARRIRPGDPAVSGSFDETLTRLLPTVLPPGTGGAP